MNLINVRITQMGPQKGKSIVLSTQRSGTFIISNNELEEFLIERGDLCITCRGTGELEQGEFDDKKTVKCIDCAVGMFSHV